MAAYRFVPRFAAELRTIRAAHRVKGVRGGGGIGGRYKRLKRYSVPLLAGAVQHGERVALAMDLRVFGAPERRTCLRCLRFARRDLALVALFWLGSLALVLLAHRPPVSSGTSSCCRRLGTRGTSRRFPDEIETDA